MSWVTWTAIYVIVWWIMLFAVLPIGVQTQADAGEQILGTAPSAPVNPRLGLKALLTSLVAAVVLGAFYYAVEVLGLSLDDIPIGPDFS
ncbi:DUF1467 family protein [Coralliovum pocilloporae]|uniref:DUF1467 family protein n=1 Tax=Coralliovum pocilloporae TaxID=3066369 RepID=UPI003306AA05